MDNVAGFDYLFRGFVANFIAKVIDGHWVERLYYTLDEMALLIRFDDCDRT